MTDVSPLRTVKNKLRSLHRKARRSVVRSFLSYDSDELVKALRRLGISPGDSIMLHSAFEPHHGFRGSLEAAIDAFLEAIGPDGNASVPWRWKRASGSSWSRERSMAIRCSAGCTGMSRT